MRKVLYISGSRADFGLMRLWLKYLNDDPRLGVEVAVTGTHLNSAHKGSLTEIKDSGLSIACEIKVSKVSSENGTVLNAMGSFMSQFRTHLEQHRPDFIMVEADRWEALAAAICGVVMGVPVVHISGGDVSGSMDGTFRHAITKLSHLHFPGTKLSASRIKAMGEEAWRVHMVGTPINLYKPKYTRKGLERKFEIKMNEFYIVLQHPVSTQSGDAGRQMRATLEAIANLKKPTIIIHPNGDPGSTAMLKEIQWAKKLPFVRVHSHVPSDLFMNLMAYATVLIGNSSAGIVEAPFFELPVVDVGVRQAGRERGSNVINVPESTVEIQKAIKRASVPAFRKRVTFTPYTYCDKPAKLVEVLASEPISERLLYKGVSL